MKSFRRLFVTQDNVVKQVARSFVYTCKWNTDSKFAYFPTPDINFFLKYDSDFFKALSVSGNRG